MVFVPIVIGVLFQLTVSKSLTTNGECNATDPEAMSVLQSQKTQEVAKHTMAQQEDRALEEHVKAVMLASQRDGEDVPAPACTAGGNYCPPAFQFYTGNVCGETGAPGSPCYAVGEDPGKYKACPNEMAAIQWCSSGENENCVNPADGSSFVSWWMYCSVPVPGMNPQDQTVFFIQYDCQDQGCTKDGTPWQGCPSGSVITAACASGKNPDCDGNLMKIACTQLPGTAKLGAQSTTCNQPLGGAAEWSDFVVKPCTPGSVLTEVMSSGRDQNIKCNGQKQHSGAYCSPLTISTPQQPFTPDQALGYWTILGSASGSMSITQTVSWSSSVSNTESQTFSNAYKAGGNVAVQVGTGAVTDKLFKYQTKVGASFDYTRTMSETSSKTNSETQGGSTSIEVSVDCNGYVWQWVQNQSQAGTDMWALTETNFYVCTHYGTDAYMPACPAMFCANVLWTDSDSGCDCCSSAAWTDNATVGEASVCENLK